jgi:hypothetical protein
MQSLLVNILKLFSHDIYKVWYQNVPISYHYQMEIHLGLLPYPKENDTSEEVFVIILTLCC